MNLTLDAKLRTSSATKKLDEFESDNNESVINPLSQRVCAINDMDWDMLECMVRSWEKWDLLARRCARKLGDSMTPDKFHGLDLHFLFIVDGSLIARF